MEEDRDLEELKKAIDSGDKDRAKSIATTLLKQRSKLLNNPNQSISPPSWLILIVLAVAALAPVAYSILELWLKRNPPSRSKKEEYAYV